MTLPAPRNPLLGSGSGSSASCRQWWVSESILGNWARTTKVVPLGDLQYNDGAYADFIGSYDDKSWGRLNAKVAPVMGNHEASGQGYFDYFNGIGKNTGVAGTRGNGWYSYNTGSTANRWLACCGTELKCVGKNAAHGKWSGCATTFQPTPKDARLPICTSHDSQSEITATTAACSPSGMSSISTELKCCLPVMTTTMSAKYRATQLAQPTLHEGCASSWWEPVARAAGRQSNAFLRPAATDTFGHLGDDFAC